MTTRSLGRNRSIGWMAAILAIGLLPVVGVARAAEAGSSTTAPEPPAHPPMPVPPDGHAVPPLPDIPKPPKKVQKLMTGTKSYELKSGEEHDGDLYFMSESVKIDGSQTGDLVVFGREVEIGKDGKVSGDVNAWVQTAVLDGAMGDTVRVFCGDLTVKGKLKSDLIAVCGQITVEPDARIDGDVDLKGAEIDFRGSTGGSLTATGGQVTLAGKVTGDATLKGDVVNVLPGANVQGDLDYAARKPIDLDHDKDEIVKGEVTYNQDSKKTQVSSHSIGKWFGMTCLMLLTGLGVLAIFRRGAPAVLAAVRDDALRSAGIGFITIIVVPVAAAISCILIITIPAALLVILAWGLLLYLAQVPVALWLGEWVLGKAGRPAASPFVAFLAGVPLLYLVFAVPFVGKLALFATLFVGYGAIVMTLWNARQARRAGTLPPGSAPMSPSAPVSAV